MTEKYCPNCNEFEENVDTIDSAVALAYIHGQEISVKPFLHCPYCGSELQDK